MQLKVTYTGGLDSAKVPAPGVWSNWHLFNCDEVVWYRVQRPTPTAARLLMQIQQPKTSIEFTCYLLKDKLYCDVLQEHTRYVDWMFQALRRILPGVKEVSRA